MLKKLSLNEFRSDPDPKQLVLDAVIQWIAGEDYIDLAPRQKVAQLVLIYDNEVCNGGHLQYFHNQGVDFVEELLLALEEIGAACQREVFEKAKQYVLSHPVKKARTLEEYSERARKHEFRRVDDSYYACRPEISDELLPTYIQSHLEDFIELE